MRRLSLPVPEVIDGPVAQHAEVIDGLRAGDPDRDEAVLRDHLRWVLNSLPALVSEHPGFFVDDDVADLAGAPL